MFKFLKKISWNVWILILCTIITAIFHFFTIEIQSIWLDEAYSIYLSENIFRFWNYVFFTERNMFFYYFILHFWMFLGNSEFVVRSLSVIFSIISLSLIYILASNLFNKKVGAMAVVLLSLNIFFITYAQEARSYVLVLLLTTLLSNLFIKLVKNRFANKTLLILYLLTSVLLVYSHFFGILVIITHLFSFILYINPFKKFKELIVIISIPLISLLPYILISSPTNRIGWIKPPSFIDIIDFYYYVIGGKYILIIFFISVLLFIIKNIRKGIPDKEYRWKILFLLNLTILPVLMICIASIFITPLFVDRYLIIILPGLILLFSTFIDNVYSNTQKILIVMVIIFLSLINIRDYIQNAKKNDWRNATKFIVANYQQSDVLIFYKDATFDPVYTAFDYYYQKSNNKYKLNDFRLDSYDYKTLENVEANEIILVLSNYDSDDIKEVQQIRNHILKTYEIISSKEYTGVEIEIYRSK